MSYTLRDIVDFCSAHRGKRGFPTGDYDAIATEICRAHTEQELLYCDDEQGICGVIIYTIDYKMAQLYIKQIICVRTGFRTFLHLAASWYPGFSIIGRRGNKLVNFKKLWQTIPQV